MQVLNGFESDTDDDSLDIGSEAGNLGLGVLVGETVVDVGESEDELTSLGEGAPSDSPSIVDLGQDQRVGNSGAPGEAQGSETEELPRTTQANFDQSNSNNLCDSFTENRQYAMDFLIE